MHAPTKRHANACHILIAIFPRPSDWMILYGTVWSELRCCSCSVPGFLSCVGDDMGIYMQLNCQIWPCQSNRGEHHSWIPLGGHWRSNTKNEELLAKRDIVIQTTRVYHRVCCNPLLKMFTKRTVFPTAVNLYHCLRELSFLIRTI